MALSLRLETAKRLSGAAVAGGLVVVLSVMLTAGGSDGPRARGTALPMAPRAADVHAAPSPRSDPLRQAWPRRLTVVSDSVGLGSIDAMRATMPGWRVRVVGQPALMIDDAAERLRRAGRLDKIVVVALGYNTLWKRGRIDFDYFAAKFDREADRLLRVIRAKGGRKVIWVTLRDAARANVPRDGWHQHATYAWYFPYVNTRLRTLDRRRDDVVLADWAAVSDRRGITYDAFHLDPDGAVLYSRVIKHAVLREPFSST